MRPTKAGGIDATLTTMADGQYKIIEEQK